MSEPRPVPIVIRNLVSVQVVYIGTFSEEEREWLRATPKAKGLVETMCPGIDRAICDLYPHVTYSVDFAINDEEEMLISSDKYQQIGMGSDLITQPGWVKWASPAGTHQRYNFRLNFYLQNTSGEEPGKVTFVGPQHPLFPET